MYRLLKSYLYAVLAVSLYAGGTALAQTPILSFHNAIANTGVNSTETTLTPANVNTSSFSKRFATTVDGKIYAQPLYVPGVNVVGGANAGTHNLAIVATQHDSLFAIDAQSGIIVWQTSFTASGLPNATTITSVPSTDVDSTDTSPEIGICSTPVIDSATNYLYCAAKTKQIISGATTTPHYVYTLYAINIANGNATANANIVASTVIGNTTYTTSSGSLTFNTASSTTAAQDPFVFGTGNGAITVNGTSRVYLDCLWQMNRPGLRLYNGNIYIGFGSHGDNGPYHGWLLSYAKSTLTLNGVLNTTPNAGLGGVWGGGAAPAVDENGYIYLMTGNGLFDGYNNNGATAGLNSLGFPVNANYGDSILKIAVDSTTSQGNQNTNGWGLAIVDYFSPFNSGSLDSSDTDLGSGGVLILPDSAGSATYPHLLVGSGKQGMVYLVNRDNMGKFTATTDNIVQEQGAIGECFDTPCFFNGTVYYAGVSDNVKAFTVTNAVMSTTPVKSVDTMYWPGANMAVSANGTTNGILWGIDTNSQSLRAYQASNVANELWNSTQAANNSDALGTAQKFAAPTVADGQVFAPTSTALVVYGPPPTSTTAPAAPTNLTATAVSSLQVNLSWTNNATNETGFSIEQSSNGVNFSQVGTVITNVTTYSAETSIAAGSTYYFRVRAFNGTSNTNYSTYSNVVSVTTPGYPPSLNLSSGFAGSTGTLVYNGSAAIVNSRARITNGGGNEAGTVFSAAAQPIANFTTSFTFQETSASADGFTFIIQNVGNTVVGTGGGGLGFAGINNSVAVKFDIWSNAGEGNDSTGLFTNGTYPTVPAINLSNTGIVLNSGDVMSCTLTYNGTTLTEVLTDTVTGATVTESYTINIASTIGSSTAYVGFGGGTGGATAIQDILGWSFSPLPTTAPATPSGLSATATSGTAVNLAWTSNSTNDAGFLVMRATGTGSYTQVGVTGANVTTYTDSGLIPNTTYSYEVIATNNIGNSSPSNVATVTPPTPPATPTNAQATSITTTSISMSWTNNATNATGYNILRKMTSGNNFALVATLPSTATTYTDTGLASGTSYDYHIQCFNVAGYSDFSGFTAVTLAGNGLPIITVSSSPAVAVNNVSTGQITFTTNTTSGTALPISYTVSGTGVAGTDYTALSGTVTLPASATSVSVPVTAAVGATSNATVIASIATTSAYTAGTPASATVVLEPAGYGSTATAQTVYASSNVAGTAGGNVTLTFQGLPGNPAGAVYVWYLGGNAFATTTSPSYTLTGASTTQSGTYSVYAWAPSGITGSASYAVNISPISVVTSTGSLTVPDGSTGTFTVGLSGAPTANTVVNLSIAGTPNMTVSPATATMTPASYQNQPVYVTAGSINSNDSNRTAAVTCATTSSTATVNCTDVISDPQTAANLTGVSTPLTGTNIGAGSAGDSSVHASGDYWVDGSGAGGISSTADAFHLESQSYSGNFTMVVDLVDLVGFGATTPRAGLIVRDGAAAGSNYLAIGGNATSPSGYDLDSRTSVNGASTETITSGAGQTYTYPNAWLMITRAGNVLHAFVSSNGTAWTEVTNPSTGVTWTGMSSSLSIGLFSSSASSANTRAVFSNFSITAASSTPTLTDGDVGSPPLAGSASYNNGVYTQNGCGGDIWDTVDQFNFNSVQASGTNTIIVQVQSVQNTSGWAKCGPMFRLNNNDPSSPYFGIFATGGVGVTVQYRDTEAGIGTMAALNTSIGNPNWLELVWSGSTMTAYYATTTTTPTASQWTLMATHTVPYASTSYYAGLAVCSHNTAALCTATFANLTIGSSTTPPPPAAPAAPSGLTATVASSSQIGLSWTSNSTNQTGFIILRSINGGVYSQLNTTGASVTTYTDTGLAPSTSYSYEVEATNSVGSSAPSNVATGVTLSSTTTPMLTDADVGSPPLAGSATLSSGVYTLKGCGGDIWDTVDQFNFDSVADTGNSTVTVQVQSVQNTNGWAKSGPMFRLNANDPSSPYFGIFATGGVGVTVQYRDTEAGIGTMAALNTAIGNPNWLRIVWSGTTMTAYYATTTSVPTAGQWVLLATHTVPYASTSYYAGLADCSHNTAALCTSTFANFTLTNP